LANDWGNLCNRTISMARKYFPGETFEAASSLKSPLLDSTREVVASFEVFRGELKAKLDAVLGPAPGPSVRQLPVPEKSLGLDL
jgi:methionyl-tRNA synthetase